MWCHLPTSFARRLTLRSVVLGLLYIVLSTTLVFAFIQPAAADINRTLAFQGRLLNGDGGVVPDGHYNIQFKLYQGGDGQTAGGGSGTLAWTETYINNNGNQGVNVKNGYFSVYLGSQNPLTNVDWNQNNLWLSMNVAGSSNSCTNFGSTPCEADGEMLPMRHLTASPYAMNAGAVGGKTVEQLLQLAQGVQTDTSNTSSVFINKTGTGNLIQFQNTGSDIFTVTNSGDIQFGAASQHTISIAQATEANSNGADLTINAGAGNGTGSDGNLYLGTNNTADIQIGTTDSATTQTITIGTNNTAGSSTNVTIGAGAGAASGSTTIQSKDTTAISTNGTTRAVFGTNGTLSLGNGVTSETPTDFRIQGTASSATGISGSLLTVQGGNATVGDADGGNLHLSGGNGAGSGTKGLVVIDTPTYASAATQASATDTSVMQTNVDSFGVISLKATAEQVTFTMPDPTRGAAAAGRIIYLSPTDDSYDFSLTINTGQAQEQTLSLQAGHAASLLWNGTSWLIAGASQPSSLQAAYDNTIQSSNQGAELIVSNSQAADGLTIRDSSTNPVNNSLLEVQNTAADSLFSVKSNLNELISNPGIETAGETASSLPSNSWSAQGAATINRLTTPGDHLRTGQASLQVATSQAGDGVNNHLTTTLTPNTRYTFSAAVRLDSGSFSDLRVSYTADGTALTPCVSSVHIFTDNWKTVSCSFTTPASGLTSANAIRISQDGAANHQYYLDDASLSQASDNLVSDGDATDSGTFATNWTSAGEGTVAVSQDTNVGYNDSYGVRVDIQAGANNAGVRNKLQTAPQVGKAYTIRLHGASDTSFNDFVVRYSPDGGTSFVDCANYSTQSISAVNWSEVSCTINTGTTQPTNPYLYFGEASDEIRAFYIDAVSMTQAAATTATVKVGNDTGNSPTLFTVDKATAAPTAADSTDLLGSMYYDTTLGKLQCYQAEGWGDCGDRPDTFITLSPEYANAVMNGTDVGEMTSGLCSDPLDINDGSSGQPTICCINETYKFYKWTSAVVSDQTKNIFVTYQLPDNFKQFVAGSTSLMSRTDSTDATVSYQLYRNKSDGGMVACGTTVTAATGAHTSWNKATVAPTEDPAHCDFAAGDSLVFRINLTAKNDAHAYISTIGFTYSSH